jgi:uncharacterized protein (TIGR03435 family)
MIVPAYAYYSQAPAPAFDAATVRPSAPIVGDTYNINTGKILHGVVTLGNATLSDCLKFAYSLTSDIQLAAPEWASAKGHYIYDVTGKAPADTPQDLLLQMLQALLKERFQLAMHTEQREMKHYELVVAKNGPKMHESSVDAGDARGSARLDGITSNRMQMNKLAMLMSRMTRMPVIDSTGLNGFYEIKLQWAPEDLKGSGENPLGPSIFTAVEEQLGLKLLWKKGPVEVLVVDRAEKVPLEN